MEDVNNAATVYESSKNLPWPAIGEPSEAHTLVKILHLQECTLEVGTEVFLQQTDNFGHVFIKTGIHAGLVQRV